MKRTLREEEEGKELPTIPLDIVMCVLSHLKLESVSMIFGLLRLCKEVKERSNELLPCLVKGWTERILAGDNASEEFRAMTNPAKDYTVTKSDMKWLLEKQKEKPNEEFAQNLFDYQIFILDREWMNQKISVRKEPIMYIHKEGERQRNIKDLYYFDEKVKTVTPLWDYPQLSCINMKKDIYDVNNAVYDMVREATKGNHEIIMRYALNGMPSKKSTALRSDFYELRKKSDEPFTLSPVSEKTRVCNLVIGDTHIFCPEYNCPYEIGELRAGLYSCFHSSTSYQFHDRQRTLLRYLTGKTIHKSFLEKFHL